MSHGLHNSLSCCYSRSTGQVQCILVGKLHLSHEINTKEILFSSVDADLKFQSITFLKS